MKEIGKRRGAGTDNPHRALAATGRGAKHRHPAQVGAAGTQPMQSKTGTRRTPHRSARRARNAPPETFGDRMLEDEINAVIENASRA